MKLRGDFFSNKGELLKVELFQTRDPCYKGEYAARKKKNPKSLGMMLK